GTRGPGTEVKDGFRQALLTPNTVELLDTTTLSRKKLSGLPNSNIYASSDWDRSTDSIVTSVISKEAGKSGLYTYNLASNVLTKIDLPTNNTKPYSYVSSLTSNKLLLATTEDSSSTLGNLGEGY